MQHASPITTVDAAARSQDVVTGGYDGRVILWRDGRSPQWCFKAGDLINQVSYSPDEASVAVASADAYVYVLDARDGAVKQRFGPFGDDANAVAWHPSGQAIACAMDAWDRVVRLIDTVSGREVVNFTGHRHGVFAMAFDATGSRLVTSAEDATARIWDTRTGRELRELGHPGDPETVDWSPAGALVATGCDDGILRIWDADSGELLRQWAGATAAVRFVRFSPDGRRLLVGSYDGRLQVLDTNTFAVEQVHSTPFQWERAAAFGQDQIVVGSFGGQPILYREGTSPTAHAPTFGINCIAFGESNRIFVGRDDGTVSMNVSGAFETLVRHDSIVNHIAVKPDTSTIASCDYLGSIILFDTRTGQVTHGARAPGGPINALQWLPDGSLASAGYDGHIRYWTPDLLQNHAIEAHGGPIKTLAHCQTTGLLLAGSSDNTISAWSHTQMRYRIERDDLVLVNDVSAAASVPVFASASRDGLVRLWHSEDGRLKSALPRRHIKSVKGVAISASGERVLSGSYDGSAILWVVDGQAIELCSASKPGIPAVQLSSTRAVVGSWDGTLRSWTLDGRLEWTSPTSWEAS